MLKRIATYVGFALLWAVIVVVVVCAERLTTKNNKEQLVTTIDITVEGGGNNPVVDGDAISWWLKVHNAHPEGISLEKLDIATIENVVESHTAVAEANVIATYDGCVEIDITQREPIARMRISGYDIYITRDGYLLPARGVTPVHVPVITGDYKPLFGSGYVGYAEDVSRDSIAALEDKIVRLEDEKLPHYKLLIENNKTLRVIKRSSPKKNLFQSEEEYKILQNAYKERLSLAVEAHSKNKRDIREDIAELERKQEETRHLIQGIKSQSDEFKGLIKFIETIERDRFWSAEVVQIIATGGGEIPLQLAIIPRSGRFTVDLGTMENLPNKLQRLRRFYDKGLSNIGWSKYRSISLRYEGQVVCR
ncbi:MAG: hypothetical protein J6Q95_04720 [Alistipes sp.]|nr:hypothetical protein [Alistipes sp.]